MPPEQRVVSPTLAAPVEILLLAQNHVIDK